MVGARVLRQWCRRLESRQSRIRVLYRCIQVHCALLFARTNIRAETCVRARYHGPSLGRVCTPKLPLCASLRRNGGRYTGHGRNFRVEKASAVSLDRKLACGMGPFLLASFQARRRYCRAMLYYQQWKWTCHARRLYTRDDSIVHGEINPALLIRSGFNFSPVRRWKANVWKGNIARSLRYDLE